MAYRVLVSFLVAVATVSALPAAPPLFQSSSVDPRDEALQYVGRWDLTNTSAPAFQWPASSIAFTLECSANSTIAASFDTYEAHTKFGIYLNDQAAAPVQLVKSGSSTVQASIPSGTTVVSVVKLTEDYKPNPGEGSQSMLGPPSIFHGLKIDPEVCTISAAPRKQRRMQFIGDSITCGFGNQVENPIQSAACLAASAITAPTNVIGKILYSMEDVHESYVLKLARQFNAESHVQCLSGIGMCKNGIGLSSHDDHNMTYFVDSTLPFTKPGGSNMWDYSKFQPDLLVINLGTNDYVASTGVTAPTYQEFQARYVTFVNRLMQNYEKSKTKVILACGPMTSRQCPYVKAAADLLAKDFEVAYLSVGLIDHQIPLGCAGHPNQEQDTQMAKTLAPLVQKLTGW